MIAINKPPSSDYDYVNDKPKPKLLKLTQKDNDPITTNNVFINEKIYPKSIECSLSEDNMHQNCMFINQYGQNMYISNINFINQQVSKSIINVYRHPNGIIKTRIDFKDPPTCEIFGVQPILNLKCSDTISPIEMEKK